MPVNANWLWIPAKDNLTAAGKPRLAPTDVYGKPGVKYFPYRKGVSKKHVIMDDRYLFTLVKHVILDASHWLSEPIESRADEIEDHWDDGVARFVGRENARRS